MTQKEMCEVFEKIQKYIESSEFKENATKVIKEYINKNFTDIESLVLGDKNFKNILNERFIWLKQGEIMKNIFYCPRCKKIEVNFQFNEYFEEARTLIDELHRENRITNNEYNILRDCIDKAENEIETLLPLVQYHIDELEDIAKNARRALRGMF